ncbi:MULTISPECIES: hypothetical protein [unclassified Moorena]|uniref:hypothetical protein n=1 Tax=unclassified Moorena TaxID=2683338 RepID=UPI0014015DA1|nr:MULTISPECIES: hypothetical protein [unclassified Moorena]NEO12145.1 hypothetical protein [Moorena sp. SIO3E8]NEQ00942.1 hypothetical protein [Moorena sp. SIO3F7]
MGKTWDDPEGEEKKNNEQAMQQGNRGKPPQVGAASLSYPPHPTPHTPHPTPHTPHPTPHT